MKLLVVLFTLSLLIGCDAGSASTPNELARDKEKVWVFAQFNVREEKDDLESYYYYAQIPKKLYESISHNETQSGFILLRNVKYWGNDDLINDYGSAENVGDILFRIEDIAKMSLVKGEPISGEGIEQFDKFKVNASAGDKVSSEPK